jgi:hypothetical protein
LRKEFAAVNPLPYKFSYKFQDQNGRKATLMIEDWEIGQLYWSCLKRCNNDKDLAVKKVKEKYLDEFEKKDVHLFLGTTARYHGWAKNPFIIVGVFYPPLEIQQSLF